MNNSDIENEVFLIKRLSQAFCSPISAIFSLNSPNINYLPISPLQYLMLDCPDLSYMPISHLLVPGGLGFIGSHTVVHILQQTESTVTIIDDMSNCFKDVLERMKSILSNTMTADAIQKRLRFVQGSILDLTALNHIFQDSEQRKQPIEGIMHFAAKKAIGESFQKPMDYYENNVVGSLNLFKMMEKHASCTNFIFSSTAGVYGDKDNCKETDPKNPNSPYGESKACVEMLLASLAKKHKHWKIISLRYFNPCGAHASYLLGDEPFEFPNNLFPFIQEVIVGKREILNIFGSDYPTPDGTCVRDYIHITDLANGHVMALEKLQKMPHNYDIFNLGTGNGFSVLEVVKGFERAMQKPLNYKFIDRRFGDVPKLVANIDKATAELGWKVTKNLDDMCSDSCKFILKRFKK